MSELLTAIAIVCGTLLLICALPFIFAFIVLFFAWLNGELR